MAPRKKRCVKPSSTDNLVSTQQASLLCDINTSEDTFIQPDPHKAGSSSSTTLGVHKENSNGRVRACVLPSSLSNVTTRVTAEAKNARPFDATIPTQKNAGPRCARVVSNVDKKLVAGSIIGQNKRYEESLDRNLIENPTLTNHRGILVHYEVRVPNKVQFHTYSIETCYNSSRQASSIILRDTTQVARLCIFMGKSRVAASPLNDKAVILMIQDCPESVELLSNLRQDLNVYGTKLTPLRVDPYEGIQTDISLHVFRDILHFTITCRLLETSKWIYVGSCMDQLLDSRVTEGTDDHRAHVNVPGFKFTCISLNSEGCENEMRHLSLVLKIFPSAHKVLPVNTGHDSSVAYCLPRIAKEAHLDGVYDSPPGGPQSLQTKDDYMQYWYLQHGYRLSPGAFRKFARVSFTENICLTYPIGTLWRQKHMSLRSLMTHFGSAITRVALEAICEASIISGSQISLKSEPLKTSAFPPGLPLHPEQLAQPFDQQPIEVVLQRASQAYKATQQQHVASQQDSRTQNGPTELNPVLALDVNKDFRNTAFMAQRRYAPVFPPPATLSHRMPREQDKKVSDKHTTTGMMTNETKGTEKDTTTAAMTNETKGTDKDTTTATIKQGEFTQMRSTSRRILPPPATYNGSRRVCAPGITSIGHAPLYHSMHVAESCATADQARPTISQPPAHSLNLTNEDVSSEAKEDTVFHLTREYDTPIETIVKEVSAKCGDRAGIETTISTGGVEEGKRKRGRPKKSAGR